MFKKIIYFSVLGVLTLTSCKKDFLDVNENPNTPTTTSPDIVFSNALNTTARTIVPPNRLGSLWSGQWAQSNDYIPQVEATYQFSGGQFNFWGPWYDNLFDYQYVVNNAKGSYSSYAGPAKVMEAMLFQNLVDAYGDVPFQDALKGTSAIYPKYESGQSVYDALILMLDEAITIIKANPLPSGATFDILFKGDESKWIQFANTLKLRILMRQNMIAGKQTYIQTELAKIIAEGSGLLKTDAIINPGYSNSAGKLNPLYSSIGYNDAGTPVTGNVLIRMNSLLIDQLKDNVDTFRLKRIAYPIGGENGKSGFEGQPVAGVLNIANKYTGAPLGGRGPEYGSPATSAPGPSVIVRGKGAEYGIVILSAAESYLLQAEAALKYAVAGLDDAKGLYESGVRASFSILGVANEHASTLLTNSANFDAATTTEAKFRLIWFQKWVALANYNGFEAWNEYRRTNYPVVPKSLATSKANAPWRLYYPDSEKASNSANYKVVDPFTQKIFWDVN